ncbi:sterol desaturase family protein [Leptospira sp. GIMC2001]|uniref:sterol desaturase family protein n=1 Tax=Leptospira sp. GIMC2001 TaxID=1513297 RepID=UPI00234AB024|nr:sterol desaturase family protein [Leptospira sp. GIMC2001]WCL50404.1 sterol desaturase family protein [Leptospira sp. GIMC2001]
MPENFIPPPYVTFAIPFFFLLIFIEMGIGFFKNKNYYRINDSITDLSTGILSQLWGLFQKGVSLFAYFYLYENFRLATIPIESVVGWIACIILWDFCYYWFHRVSHEVNLFWSGHVIHHTSEEYNLIVALRQSGIGGFLSWIFYLPLAIIGFNPWVFLAAGQINLIYQFWVHTKAVKSIGTVGEFILSTPAHHRVHHAINPKYIDRNHGGIFIIWDRLFGTFQQEEEECVYGTVKPLGSFNPVWANFHYLLEIAKMSWKAKGITNKIKVWFKPPGWIPPMKEGEQAVFLKPPEVDPKKYVKFDPRIENGIKFYTLAWFVLTLIISFMGLLFVGKMSPEQIIALTIWVTLSLTSFGWILESRSISMIWEPFRLLTSFGLLYYFTNETIYIASLGLIVALSIGFMFFKRNIFRELGSEPELIG